ncbi:MAG: cytochrome c3 family protein [Thermoguttaceae bacterium]
MKHLVWIAAAGMVVMAGWLALAADRSEETAKGLSPLRVDRAAPLLLDEPPPRSPTVVDPKKPIADNSACFVCHGNFQEESMVAVHAQENIGCVKCHGVSLAHRNDEDNVTAPDKMYAPARIDNACRVCHEDHDASPRKVIAMFQARFPPNTDPKKVVCTDCHGEHRLKVRSVYWDKSTGKLLGRNREAAEKSGVGKKESAEEKP